MAQDPCRSLFLAASTLALALLGCDRGEAPTPALQVNEPAAPTTVDEPTEGRHVIDAHSHLFGPDAWPEIEAVMDEVGIDTFVNLSGGSPRRGMARGMALAEASGNRILNLMNVNWDGVDEPAFGEVVADELELCVTRYGYAGLKISKALGLYVEDDEGNLLAVDDPRLFPVWERAGQLGVPVFIHTSDPLAFWQPVTPENERYAELSAHPNWSFAGPEFPARATLLAERDHVFELFPDTTFVAVHFGNNPEDVDYVDQLLQRFPNVYVDVAARVPELGRHDPEHVRDIFLRHQNRILFGTDIALGRTRRGESVLVLGSSGPEPDTPDEIPTFYERHFEWLETDHRGMTHPTPIQGDWTIDAINLPPDVLQRIYYQNAYDLVVSPWLARNHPPASSTNE